MAQAQVILYLRQLTPPFAFARILTENSFNNLVVTEHTQSSAAELVEAMVRGVCLVRKGSGLARNQATNQKLKDERREQILSVALLLFATNGVAATKVTDIAAAAGMSQGLMYHYFSSKEAIFAELIRGAFERLNDACRQLAIMPEPPHEKIRMALAALIQGLSEQPDHARYHLLIAQATVADATPPEVQAIIEQENHLPYTIIAQIMRAGQQAGTIVDHDADELALLFWNAIKGLAIHKAVHGDKFKAPDPELLMKMFLP
jgi:AcrR family transcriptional regulator